MIVSSKNLWLFELWRCFPSKNPMFPLPLGPPCPDAIKAVAADSLVAVRRRRAPTSERIATFGSRPCQNLSAQSNFPLLFNLLSSLYQRTTTTSQPWLQWPTTLTAKLRSQPARIARPRPPLSGAEMRLAQCSAMPVACS